jgi:hypothetical protein
VFLLEGSRSNALPSALGRPAPHWKSGHWGSADYWPKGNPNPAISASEERRDQVQQS